MSSTASPEVDSSPSRKSLTSKLTKARRKKQREPPESSQSSLAQHDESNNNLQRMKNSIDLAVEKIKTRTSGEINRESDHEGKPKPEKHGVKDLLRRTKRKSRRRSQAGQGEDERGRTPDSKSVNLERPFDSPHTSRSTSTKGWGRSQSSLLTYDSESPEHRTPPPLVTRPSHAGYLTLSSPLVLPAQDSNGAGTQERASIGQQGEAQVALDARLQSGEGDRHESGVPELVVTSTAPISAQPALPDSRNNEDQLPAVGSRSKEASRSPGLADQYRLRDRPLPREPADTSPTRGVSPHSSPAPLKQTIPNPGTQATRPRVITAVRDGDLPTTPPSNAATPITTVTPPTPIDRHHELPPHLSSNKAETKTRPRKPSTERATPGAGQMLAHRRVQSTSAANPPSRLSRHISPPLTPTVEETRSALNTPGAVPGPSGQGGFFSSVFSAAQNAASTLSSSIANTSLATGNRIRTPTQAGEDNLPRARGENSSSSGARTEREKPSAADQEDLKESRSLAVETLGMGDLSLSHLGITVDPSDEGSTSATSNGHASSRGPDVGGRTGPAGTQPAKTMPNDVGQPVDASQQGSRARTGTGASEPATLGTNGDANFSENGSVPVVEDAVSGVRPRSMQSVMDKSGAASAAEEPDTDLKRSGSLRNRVDHSFRRRREGSAATGTTTATAMGTNATTTTTTTPITPGIVPRLTGFAVASKKRNRDFHNLFRSVPEDDFLIEDYSAAIQKDILLHGRLYVSEGHICFNSNIFGYVTTLVISFDEVVSVEKKNTAMVFPNAIVIQTLHARNVFASLASRESTYDLIVGIWKISHPNLRSSLNGVQLDEAGGGDKTVKAEGSGSDGQGDEDEDDEEEAIYDEDADGGDVDGSLTEGGDGSKMGSDVGDGAARAGLRKTSAGTSAAAALDGHSGEAKVDKAAQGGSAAVPDFPGPATHKPTECGDQDQHFERITRDEVVAAPLGKIYSLLFGASSGVFMANWLRDEQKVLDLQMEDDKTGLTETTRSRSYSYIKPITAPIGPKSTKCIITETLDALDLEKAVSVTVLTQTPDVPSGNVFSVRTRYCLTWAENNGTRLFINCTIDWTGKSWLKGPIEKGANDGQITYTKELVSGLRAAISSRAPPSTLGVKGRVKRRKRDVAEAVAQSTGKPAPGIRAPDDGQTTRAPQNWGPLEPLRQQLSPILDLLSPLLNAQVGMVVMSVLLLISWFRPPQQPYHPRGAVGVGGSYMSSERLAAYEEMWRREEGSLWDWLDERVGVDRLSSSGAMRGGEGDGRRDSRPPAPPRQGGRSSSKDGKLSEQQVAEALRLTQQRLDELRNALEGRQDEPRSPTG